MGWYMITNLIAVDHYSYTNTVPDPGLEIRGWGESSRPLDKDGPRLKTPAGEATSPPQKFSALWASVWSKNKEGAPAPAPSPGSATFFNTYF